MLVRIPCLVAIALITAGCGSNASFDKQNQVTGDPSTQSTILQQETDPNGIPSPLDAFNRQPAKKNETSQVLFRHASEYEEELAQWVTTEGNCARIAAGWVNERSPVTLLGYALYSFNLTDYEGPQMVELSWAEGPQESGKLWVGLSDWQHDRWAWHEMPQGGVLDLGDDGLAPYTKSDTGNMLVAVVLLGITPAVLGQIDIGFSSCTNWSMFGSNARHTRQCGFTGPTNGNQLWEYVTDNIVTASPAVANDGTIYVGSEDVSLYAMNPDGSVKWTFESGGGATSSSPAIASNGDVYFACNDGYLYAVDSDGNEKWKYNNGDLFFSSPTIGSNDVIYFGSWDNALTALDSSGQLLWSFETARSVCSTPAIGLDGTIYVGDDDHTLYAIDQAGNLKWKYKTLTNYFRSSPAIGNDGTIYIGSNDRNLYAFNPDGSIKWTYLTGDSVRSTPSIAADGTIYVGSHDRNLYAINPDGTLKWQLPFPNSIYASAAIDAQGTVYVSSTNTEGDIYAINPNGTVKWSANVYGTVESSPAISSDGRIYIGTMYSRIYAFGDE